MANLFVLALPLGIAVSLLALVQSIPRFYIERHHGEYALGIFGALAALITAGNMVIGALARTATPRLAKYHADGNYGMFIRLLAILVALGAGVGVCGILVALLAGRPILELFFSSQYAAHSDLLVALMIMGSLLYVNTLLGSSATALRRFKSQSVLYATCALAAWAASAALVPSRGLMGAVYAQGAASLLRTVFLTALIARTILSSRRDAAPVEGQE